MIERLRPKYSDEELKEIYSVPHSHHHWLDHKVRVRSTVALGSAFLDASIRSIADLSCGDAYIPTRLAHMYGIVNENNIHLGDFAPGYRYHGPIEDTIRQIPEVDLGICSETLEHLDSEPVDTLRLLSTKFKKLILSTPVDENIENPQHYWRYSEADLDRCLLLSGWKVKSRQKLTFDYLNGYGYIMFACDRV